MSVANRAIYLLAAIAFILLITANSVQSASPIEYGGYIKGFFGAMQFKPVDGLIESETDVFSSLRLRFKFRYQPTNWLDANLAYEIIPHQKLNVLYSSIPAFQDFSQGEYRIYDLPHTLYEPQGNLAITQNLDRANVHLALPFADIYIGRQVIAFGSARAVNPTDIFAPFNINELDTEERRGVNAIRMRIPVGDMNEIDSGFVFGKHWKFDESAVFVRGKAYLFETDISMITAIAKENLLLGIDLARNLGDAGIWFEAAYTFAKLIDDYTPDDNFFRVSTGIDFSPLDGLYVFSEYHLNTAGSSNPQNYLQLANHTAYSSGMGIYLLGRHYLTIGIQYQVTALATLTVQPMVNLSDSSAFALVRFDYSLAENLSIEAGAMLAYGASWKYDSSSFGVVSNSEFGIYPNLYYYSVKAYF